jgi:hypothetical protein
MPECMVSINIYGKTAKAKVKFFEVPEMIIFVFNLLEEAGKIKPVRRFHEAYD